jgi:hypothetical protein
MPFLSSSTNSSPSPERVWGTAFNEFGQRIKYFFVRQEPYHQALVYALAKPREKTDGK